VFSLYAQLALAFGVIFQMPVLVFTLARLGLVTAGFLWRNTKYAVLIIFIIAAVVTPTSDVVTQTLMAAPMILLYLISIAIAAIFGLQGIVYNVQPLRSKDIPYFDVISESINNPIRLTLGWAMIDPTTLPPSSLLLGYWTAGAFLMAAKRLSEYRDISSRSGVDMLQRYRRSFRYYTAESLTVSCFLYAMMSAFFIAVFLTRYRLEYIVALPFIAILFASYLWLSMLKESIAQRPERMFRSKRLVAALSLAIIAILVTSFVDLPFLNQVLEPGFIPVNKLK